ncbi:MAG: hypothetical protein ABDI07_02375 [Candidatus Kryptonium sp.]
MKASEIIEAVDKFSKGGLKEKDSLEFLLTVAIKNDKMDLIYDIAFHSKFLWKILSFLKSGRKFDEIDEESYKGRITEQINQSIDKIRNSIFKILENCSDAEKQNFVDKFMKLDPESFENFMNIIHDFYWFKNWQIDKG